MYVGSIHTCTRFQLGANSATGSVATEQSAPINIICLSSDEVVTWSMKPRRLDDALHC